MKQFFYRILAGLVIGVGAILPGVSGGIIAVSLGLYERMVSAVSGFFHSARKNALFLLPIGIGGALGLLLTSNVLKVFIERNEASVLALFSGFVLGNVPWLFLEAKGEKKFRKRYMLALVGGLVFVLMFALFELGAAGAGSEAPLSPLLAIVAGAVLAVGVVIPGISSSFLLIYMGMYASVLTAIARVDIPMLFFAGVGFVAMGFGIIKLVNWMLKKHRALSYFAIIGFVVGSVALVVPRVIEGLSWTSPFLFVIGLAVSVFQGFLKARRIGLSADLGTIPELAVQKNAKEGGGPAPEAARAPEDAPDPDGETR